MTVLSSPKKIKQKLIEQKIKEILEILDLKLTSFPGLKETPKNVSKLFLEKIAFGIHQKNFPKLQLLYENIPSQILSIKNIPFVSFCEHHLVPFIGEVHINYKPNDRLLGFGEFRKIINFFSSQPQLQERFTHQIASSLMKILNTKDVAVMIRAQHTCILMRSLEGINSQIDTYVMNGCFLKDQLIRNNFLAMFIGK